AFPFNGSYLVRWVAGQSTWRGTSLDRPNLTGKHGTNPKEEVTACLDAPIAMRSGARARYRIWYRKHGKRHGIFVNDEQIRHPWVARLLLQMPILERD